MAAVFVGSALTLTITLVTGREAVREQNAKEANITRKYTYYIPIFNELKQIYDILGEAKQKSLPYPQCISGIGNEAPTSVVWAKYPIPTFTKWGTFKEDPDRSNFTEKACKLFDEVQKSGTEYNKAVREAKDPVIKILNPKVDTAFREWADSDDFKQWKEETNGGNALSSAQYHDRQIFPDWTPMEQCHQWRHNSEGTGR